MSVSAYKVVSDHGSKKLKLYNVRSGNKLRALGSLVIVLFALPALSEHHEDRISTASTGANEYELTLESTTVYDIPTATKLLVPAMKELCQQKYIELGRYRFDSDENVTSESGKAENSFKLVQKIRCLDEAPTTRAAERKPLLTTPEQRQAVVTRVERLSKDYFQSFYKNLGDDAASAMAAFAERDKNRSSGDGFQPQPISPGTPIDISIVRTTIYDNTPDAPSAGIYVASDYQNSVGNVAYHCGYLMWHSKDGKDFTLGRVESGVVSDELLTTISGEQLPAVLQQLRCLAGPK